jgi:hypothetical protein
MVIHAADAGNDQPVAPQDSLLESVGHGNEFGLVAW